MIACRGSDHTLPFATSLQLIQIKTVLHGSSYRMTSLSGNVKAMMKKIMTNLVALSAAMLIILLGSMLTVAAAGISDQSRPSGDSVKLHR